MQGTLKDAIQYAAQNPTSDFATQLGKGIASGQYDAQARQLGIDLSAIKQKYALPVAKVQQTQPINDNVGDTVKAANLITSVFPGKQIGQSIGTLGGLAYEKVKGALGGQDNSKFYDISHPTLEQNLGDVAKGAALVGGLGLASPTSAIQAIGTGAATGGLTAAGQSMIEKQSAGEVAKNTAIGALTGGALAGAGYGIGKLLSKAGDKILNSTIKPTQADIKDGFSIDTVKQYKLGGNLPTIHDRTQNELNNLTQQLQTKLANSNKTIDIASVYDETAKELGAAKLKNFGANTSMRNALAQLEGEVLTANPTGQLSIPDAQIVKQGAGKMGAWQFGAVDPESTARERVYNVFYNKLKSAIERESPPGVAEINKKISKLIPVANAVIRRIPVAERANVLSLGDLVSISGGHLPGFLLNIASKSGTVGNILSQNAQNIGAGVAPVAGITAGNLTTAITK